jgi:hypothetical protein
MLRRSVRAVFPWSLAALFVALCAWIVFSSESFQSCISAPPNERGQQDLVEGIAALFVSIINRYRLCTGDFVHANGESIIAAFTVIIALSTIALWSATASLVKGAEDASRRQLRPYVFLDPEKEMTFVRHPSITETVEVEIHVRNMGLTPAHNVLGISWMALEKWPLPNGFNFVGPIDDRPVTRSVIPPNGIVHYHTGTGRPMTPDELAAVESGALCLYIYGHIHYTDSFGHPHWTNFCHASTNLGKQGFRTAMAKCDRHNDADRD